jgi:hypothetical protein
MWTEGEREGGRVCVCVWRLMDRGGGQRDRGRGMERQGESES